MDKGVNLWIVTSSNGKHYVLSQTQPTNAGVCTDDQHGEVRAVAGEAEDGGLQVLVVSRQVDEGDHFRGALTDLLCCPRLAVVHHLAPRKDKRVTAIFQRI